MTEAQRFLRYILPGLIAIVEFLAYLLISGDLTFGEIRTWVNSTDKAAGILIGAFLASGAIGFLFGVFYYKIFWLIEKLGVNHCLLFQIAESRKWLELLCAVKNIEVPATKLTKRGAYRLATAYLIMRAKVYKKIEGVIPRTERLADLVNALGTVCIGSILAVISFLLYNIYHGCPGQFSHQALGSLVVGVCIAALHYFNYRDVCEDCENIHGTILLEAFKFEYGQLNVPIKLYVFKEDLEKKKIWTWVISTVMIAVLIIIALVSLKKCIS